MTAWRADRFLIKRKYNILISYKSYHNSYFFSLMFHKMSDNEVFSKRDKEMWFEINLKLQKIKRKVEG